MISKQVNTEFDEYCENMPELIRLEFHHETIPTFVRAVVESLESNKRAEIIFERVEGFRVLDEGNLMEYWNEDTRSNGWLWEIESGGWKDLELERKSSFTLKSLPNGLKEYFIAGSGKCLNILCYGEPNFTKEK